MDSNALANADPDDVRLQADRARLLSKLGGVLIDAGEAREAQARLESARVLYESLWGSQPDMADLRVGLTTTLRTLARALYSTGDTQGAIDAAEEALRRLDEDEGELSADELRATLEADLARYRE